MLLCCLFKENTKMKKQLLALVGAAAICFFIAISSNTFAADPNKPKASPPKERSNELRLVIGVVSVVKDKDGNITEIKVTTHPELIYKIVLDDKGIELAKTLVDKRARIEGFIETKGKDQWVTVKTFTEAKSQIQKQPSQNPKSKPAPKQAPKK